LLLVLSIVLGLVAFAHVSSLAAQTAIPVQIGKVSITKVADWESGTRDGLLISNNADGELRLAEGGKQGVFTSKIIRTDFSYNAVGGVWRADVPKGTSLKLEVRGGPTPNEAELGPWQALPAGDARSQSDDGALALESVRPFLAATAFLQFRATLGATV